MIPLLLCAGWVRNSKNPLFRWIVLFFVGISEMKKLLLIDVDCGVDDAQAIMMALAAPSVEVLGITCCYGNSLLENTCRNVLRVLQVCNKLEVICSFTNI